ncbi:hypothetical protein F4808DRAFT_464266 [Astrocystis sublimbata]|nr:hypothetical protein F4808DRAFT_464266 [Astrocystis sublimbata]
MRFEDWDVLLFPKDSKVPIKEFKINCHVIHDSEFAYTNGSYGLPTMTCFVPGLAPGTHFNISLHSWKTPDISQFSQNYSKHPELVKFEARVLIDGRLIATSSFNRTGPWPQLINHSFEFTKNGELEQLQFPQFRNELLRQSYWSPADEVGRIKIVISEGFPRDSVTAPIERVKNMVAFSFQHAPLDILEMSGIAFPNPAMWRRGPFNPTMPVPAQQHEDGPDAHTHSPRQRCSFVKGAAGPQFNPDCANAPQLGYADPFNSNKIDMSTLFEWPNSYGVFVSQQTCEMGKPTNPRANVRSKVSHSDISMPDYSSSGCSGSQMMTDFRPMGFVASLDDADNSHLATKVPANTPTANTGDASFVDDLGIDINKLGTPGNTPPPTDFFSTDLATSLTNSLLNQPHPLPVQGPNMGIPAPEIKSRKENRPNLECCADETTNLDHIDMRKVSQSVYGQLGKITRHISNASNSPSQGSFSGAFSQRSHSGPDFGIDCTNSGNPFTHHNAEPKTGTECRIGSGSDKGPKRHRQFTPASAKAIDDEDEPRRNSPRCRNVQGAQLAEAN